MAEIVLCPTLYQVMSSKVLWLEGHLLIIFVEMFQFNSFESNQAISCILDGCWWLGLRFRRILQCRHVSMHAVSSSAFYHLAFWLISPWSLGRFYSHLVWKLNWQLFLISYSEGPATVVNSVNLTMGTHSRILHSAGLGPGSRSAHFFQMEGCSWLWTWGTTRSLDWNEGCWRLRMRFHRVSHWIRH